MKANRIYDEGIASFQDIDKALKAAYDFSIGHCELGDLIGLEVTLPGDETTYHETGKDVFRYARCHVMKMRAGDYRSKICKFFYEY